MPILLAAPLVLFMLAFYALPVVAMLMRSVSDPGWTLANYAALPDDVVFLKTFCQHLLHLADRHPGELLLGYPVALALVRAPRWAPIILILILLPFWTSVLVRSYAWMVLMGRHGLINEALIAAGLIDRPLRILNTPLATQIAMTHILLPYMILPIANALRQIDPSLLRAASGLGAPPWRTFLQVTLPLSMPGVAAGVLLVFVLALGFYITPAMVGGPREITLSMLIAQQVDQLNWAYAATLSAVLLATALAHHRRLLSPAGRRQRLPDERAMTAARLLPATVVGLILLFLAFPIVVVMVVSFSSATYLTFPPPAFGLKWYEAYFSSADWLRPTWLSIWVAAAVVVLSTVLGTLAALGIARLPRALRVVVAGLVLSPLIVPGIVVAIGIYYAFSRYGLVGSPVGLMLAHTCLAVPFVVTSVSASLAGIDPRLEQAALSLGATPRATFFQVTLPLIRPGVLVGALFAFITSFDELIVALFISGSGAVTLPRRMWDDLRFAIDPTIAAVSTLTIVLTVLLMARAHLLRRHTEQIRTA